MFFIKLISYTPLRILYLFSDFLFLISFYLLRYRRELVWKNLVNAFPEKTEKDLRIIEKQFYKNLCDYAVETLKLQTISKDELGMRMVFKTPEIPAHYANQKQSVLILTSHQFNWEWLLTAAGFNLPMPIDFVYQKVSSKFFEKISLFGRTRFGAHPIERNQVARKIVARKNIMRAIAMVADQYPGHGEDKRFTATFLNQETVFFLGTNQVALLTQYPVLYYRIKKIKRGYYEASAVELATPPYPKDSYVIVENYIKTVEQTIQADPTGWLWSHNRWKKRHVSPG